MAKKPLPTAEQLKQMLEYNPDTGDLSWKERPLEFFKNPGDRDRWNTRMAGKVALNYIDNNGYKMGRIYDRPVKAHRVAWAIHHGEWPEAHIDHINSDRADNRIENLRVVTRLENQRNQKRRRDNPSGHTGVYHIGKRWVAKIKSRYKTNHLGTFDTKEEAIAARVAAEVELGYHPQHGKK